MTTNVTAAGEAHAALISGLHEACFVSADEPAWPESSVAGLLAMPGAFAFVASYGESVAEQPVGFIIARCAADEAEIITIGILPPFRRGGIARALVHQAWEKAKSGGARRMYLEVAADNTGAMALYRGLGFVSCGLRAGYYVRPHGAVDAHVLVRDLTNGQ